MNRSATVLKASRSAGQEAAAGLRHSRAPVLGFKARTWARGILSPLRGEGGASWRRFILSPILRTPQYQAQTGRASGTARPDQPQGRSAARRAGTMQARLHPAKPMPRRPPAFPALESSLACGPACSALLPCSPQPVIGERIRRASSRLEPLNPVGTRSTASPSSGLQLGTQWNASLPVPAGSFMGRLVRRKSRIKPLNLVGTRSTASPFLSQQSGTQWNASLPVPARKFMESLLAGIWADGPDLLPF
jgi:hypothetical protein